MPNTWSANHTPLHPTKFLWTLPCPPKIRLFLWKAINKGLPTFSLLHHIHLTNSDICPRCNTDPESASHLLIYCPTATNSWSTLFNQFTNSPTSNHPTTFILTPQTTISQILQQSASTSAVSSICFFILDLIAS